MKPILYLSKKQIQNKVYWNLVTLHTRGLITIDTDILFFLNNIRAIGIVERAIREDLHET